MATKNLVSKLLSLVSAAVSDEARLLIDVLPDPLREAAMRLESANLVEIVLDLGRLPFARIDERAEYLSEIPVSHEAIEHVLSRIGDVGVDNRAGIERTLHRISALRNRRGQIIGLTLRVGRAIYGSIDILRDLIDSEQNILLLGRPGVGKTTKLREVARVLADDLHKRVIVVDTSNEIGGDGDVPHAAIGSARRMQVARPDLQHAAMIEAVENHMPEAIIIDEIGTDAEAAAARTIAERGVVLVATAHGNTLENLVLNPTLSDLVGGVHTVTLSDEEARRRGTPKTIAERRAVPTFDVVVEIVSRDELIVHPSTAEAVDRLLADVDPGGERRRVLDSGEVEVEKPKRIDAKTIGAPRTGPLRIAGYGIHRDLLERAVEELKIQARVVERPEAADMVFALRSRSAEIRLRRAVEAGSAEVHLVKHPTSTQIRRSLERAFPTALGLDPDEMREAVEEAEHVIQRVMAEGVPLSLAPRPPAVRKVQHRMVTRYRLEAESVGREPMRHLVVHPG